MQLLPGDVVLLPRGTAHALGSDADTVARTGPGNSSDYEQAGSAVVRIGSGDVRTHILCAHYDYDRAVSTPVFAPLGDLVHLRAGHAGDGLDDTLRLLGRELAAPRLATAVVLDRLVDILLVQSLRVWLAACSEPAERLVDILLVQSLRVWLAARSEPAEPSWLGVLRDPLVGSAVAKLHGEPGRDWTTASLAREIAVSRATLSRRFASVLGESPGAYLTRWRMDLAARRLRDTDEPLDEIARSVGYTSVHAFSRAFRRARSVPPGRFRVAARG